MEIEVERRGELIPVVHLTFDMSDSLPVVQDAFELGRNTGADAPIWVHGTTDQRGEVLRDGGYESDRTLLQLRVPLRAGAEQTLETRPFTEADIKQVVRVNNRAFDWHPEQAGKNEAWLRDAMSEPWFDADGFRLLEIDGRLAGFCWTKIHQNVGCDAPLGEIYVIALDPDFVGRGLGGPLTKAGLDWLAGQGIGVAMLFVESDNQAALATYEKLGFSLHRTDTLWRRTSR